MTTQSEIRTLSGAVIDQIAAGEVVERPAHLVKELIENSLDAGATEIRIEVEDGGRKVLVSDNGIGIQAQDLALALDRHSTSKIRETEDLWKLRSYGFRGEALASIAAVSRLTMTSKARGATQAWTLQSTFGTKSSIEAVDRSGGTDVDIQDLFENIPVRLKFLKSSSAEISAIRNVVKALALVHPEVQFTFRAENRLDLHLIQQTARERAQEVLGVQSLLEQQTEHSGLQVSAFFSPAQQTQRTSKHIWLFVQKRWVQDRSLMVAVQEAYRSLLMHGEYPSAALFIEVDPAQVDVNIHPTKSQVKFVNPSDVFRAVSHCLRTRLEQGGVQSVEVVPSATSSNSFSIPQVFQDENLNRVQYQTKSTDLFFRSPAPVKTEPFVIPKALAPASRWQDLQVLSQLHLTYLVCQSQSHLVLVDQHAAHERYLFEKTFQAWQQGISEVQNFLFPVVFEFESHLKAGLLGKAQEVEKFGFILEDLGPTSVGVSAAPSWIREESLGPLLEKLADEIEKNADSFAFEKHAIDLAATVACHSAIRAGQALSIEQMRALLEQMDEYPMSSFCPHGRPVSIQYSFGEIEKLFGRLGS